MPETNVGCDIELRGLLSNSFNEWYGRISAVVFTPNCNWRCPYCHGARLVTEPETLQPFTPQDLFDVLDEQDGWIDGVVISGGEPTLQPGLIDFIKQIKDKGVPVKIETNGTRPDVIEKLLNEKLIDCLCLDYKAPLDDRLKKVTCVSDEASGVENVKRSFQLAANCGIDREYHTTLCPAYISTPILEEMAQALEKGGKWFLQQYESDEVLDSSASGQQKFEAEELEELEKVARKYHEDVILRGGRETA